MSVTAVTRWFAPALLIVGVVAGVGTATLADDTTDVQKAERQLQSDAKKLDIDAARTASSPYGQRRLNERLAKQFTVDPSVVRGLRERLFSHGQAAIALAFSQQLMRQNSTLGQQAALDKVVAERQAGKGWGVIAQGLNLKLERVISDVKKAETVAANMDKPQKMDPSMAKVR